MEAMLVVNTIKIISKNLKLSTPLAISTAPSPCLHFSFLTWIAFQHFQSSFHFNVVSWRVLSSRFLSGVSLFRSEVLRQNSVTALTIHLLYFIFDVFLCARSISEVLFSPCIQFKIQHIKYDKSRYIEPNASQVFWVNCLPSCPLL